MSFNCEACGYQNNEIQSGGQVQELGIKFKVKLTQPQDLSRQIVKSDYASLIVPEIDLEIPPNSQKGSKFQQASSLGQLTLSWLGRQQLTRAANTERSLF